MAKYMRIVFGLRGISMRSLMLSLSVAVLLVSFCSLGEAVDNSLILYMPFEEGSGEITKDLSGKGNDGILKGGVQWTNDGKVGNALSFDGVDDYVSLEQQLNGLKKPKTYEMWIKPSILDKAGLGLLGIHMDGNNRWYIDLTGSAGDEIRIFGKLGGNEISQIRTVPIIKLNEWQHVAVVEDADNDAYKFYVNGEFIALTNETGGPIDFTGMPNNSESVIGARRDPTTLLHYGGIIDEVAIYTRALTQDEIKKDMEEGIEWAVSSGGKLAATWANIKAR
jgi:hypothetical protein